GRRYCGRPPPGAGCRSLRDVRGRTMESSNRIGEPGPSLHGRRQRLSMEIPSVALNSWALGRLDVVGIFQGGGSSGQVFHKAWNGSSWAPSEPDLWDRLGGFLDRPLAIVSWAANRLDIFGLSNNLANPSMLHKAWDGQEWLPSHADWERLGGTFAQPPTVASWAHDRLDIFGVGTDGSMMLHQAWDGQRWLPSPVVWEPLAAASPMMPAVASWSANRLDVVAVGFDRRMLHKAWDGTQWLPGVSTWDVLGGQFTQPPAIVAWAPDRLDIFGIAD